MNIIAGSPIAGLRRKLNAAGCRAGGPNWRARLGGQGAWADGLREGRGGRVGEREHTHERGATHKGLSSALRWVGPKADIREGGRSRELNTKDQSQMRTRDPKNLVDVLYECSRIGIPLGSKASSVSLYLLFCPLLIELLHWGPFTLDVWVCTGVRRPVIQNQAAWMLCSILVPNMGNGVV